MHKTKDLFYCIKTLFAIGGLFLFSILSPIQSEEIHIQSHRSQDRDWKVFYVDPDGYLSSENKQRTLDSIFRAYPNSQPIAIFIFGGYHTEVETNRKIRKNYPYSDFVEEVEDRDVLAYSDFLRVYCRIPVTTEYRLKAQGRLEEDSKKREQQEQDCEKDWISKTWKGNSFHFWFHKAYYRIPDIFTRDEIPDFFLFTFTVLGISFLSLSALLLAILYTTKHIRPTLNTKLSSILGTVLMGFILILIALFGFGNNEPSGPGLKYYLMYLFLLAGVYTILCFLPFWGLVNYILADDPSIPLWLILLGFFLAPLLIFAAGGLKGGGSSPTVSTNQASSNRSTSTPSPASGGGGTFGGGGASGRW